MNPGGTARAAVCALLVAGAPAGGDVATETFNSLYAKDIQKVKATRDKADDVALAKELLKAAKASEGQPALLALLCENACELSRADPAGYEFAAAAMALLAEKVPKTKARCMREIVAIRQRQFRRAQGLDRFGAAGELIDACVTAGDERVACDELREARVYYEKALPLAVKINSERGGEIEARIKRLAPRARILREFELMERRLKANAKDVLARRRLIELHAVEFDDPAQAGKLVKEKPDGAVLGKLLACESEEVLAERLSLATAEPERLSEAACLDVGEWYRRLADTKTTTEVAKPKLLKRAETGYRHFLNRHAAEDILRTRANLALNKVRTALAGLAPADAGGWMYLLKTIDLDKHAKRSGYSRGAWQRRPDGLASPPGDLESVMIPVIPKGSYHLRVLFALEGKGEAWGNKLILMLPTEGGCTHLSVGPDTCGFSIKGDGLYSRVKATVKVGFRRPHLLDVKVIVEGEQAQIIVELNRQTVIRWRGTQKELTDYQDALHLPNRKALGFGTNSAHVLVRAVKLRMLSGEAEFLSEDEVK